MIILDCFRRVLCEKALCSLILKLWIWNSSYFSPQDSIPVYFLDDCVMLKDQVLLDILPVNESIFFWLDASESLLPHKDLLSKIHNCPKDLILQPTELNFLNHFLSKKVDLVNFSSFHKIASVFAFFGIFATSSLEINVSKTSAFNIFRITWHDDGWFRNCIYQEYKFLLRSNAEFSFQKIQSDSRDLRDRRSHDQLN